MSLSLLVQAGLYDRTIWPVPEWTTVTCTWVGAPDVLYRALGFPVVAVTVTGVRLALATAAWLNRRFSLLRRYTIRVGAIAIATAGVALFNVELDQPALASLGTAVISN